MFIMFTTAICEVMIISVTVYSSLSLMFLMIIVTIFFTKFVTVLLILLSGSNSDVKTLYVACVNRHLEIVSYLISKNICDVEGELLVLEHKLQYTPHVMTNNRYWMR